MRAPTLPLVTVLFLATACGGGAGSGSATTQKDPTPLAADTAAGVMGTFLLSESQSAADSALPSLAPAGDEGVLALAAPLLNPCIGVTSGGPGTPITYTFTNCVGPNGGTLNGQITFSWVGNACTLTYGNFSATKGSQAWVLNGTKTVTVNKTAHQSQVVTGSGGITHAFTDTAAPANNRTFTYTCALLADWATPGSYKLSGTFGYQTAGDDTLEGSIPSAAPLTWTVGCCYPSMGIVNLKKGLAKADLSFGLPCGTLTVTSYGQASVTRTLAACP
jgi:hypothetical protein